MKSFRNFNVSNVLALIITVMVFSLLTACGGGGGADPVNGSQMSYTSGKQVFTVVTPNWTYTFQGVGDTLAKRQLDVANQAAQAVVPGTSDYMLLLSATGMNINVVDELKGAASFTAKLTTGGLTVTPR